jgi:hypothetical protein
MKIYLFLTSIIACVLSAYAAPTQGSTNPSATPAPTPGTPQKPSSEIDLTELEAFSPLNGSSSLVRRDESYFVCSYKWMGTAPFCDGSCEDIPGVYTPGVGEGRYTEIVRLDHPIFCPTNVNWGNYRINNYPECAASATGGTCWSGRKVFCRYDCVGQHTIS